MWHSTLGQVVATALGAHPCSAEHPDIQTMRDQVEANLQRTSASCPAFSAPGSGTRSHRCLASLELIMQPAPGQRVRTTHDRLEPGPQLSTARVTLQEQQNNEQCNEVHVNVRVVGERVLAVALTSP